MIEYRHNDRLDPQDVARVFESSGIIRPTGDLARIARMLAGADLIMSAWDGGKLIGMCRGLTDFSYCCYLSDIAVDGDYQRRGIGKRLIDMVRDAIGDEVMLVLLSAPAAMGYYPKIGLSRVENAFVIERNR